MILGFLRRIGLMAARVLRWVAEPHCSATCSNRRPAHASRNRAASGHMRLGHTLRICSIRLAPRSATDRM